MPKTRNLRDDRFRTLWTVLRWEGSFRNSQVQNLFGLTSSQASRLIADFREAFPDLIEREGKTKNWIPVRPKGNSDSPLLPAALKHAETHGGELDEYVVIQTRQLGQAPVWYEDGRAEFMAPSSDRFRLIRQACESGSAIAMTYASLTQGARERIIYPHAIVRLPQRWHVRAWCVSRREYRDFNFGRMDDVRVLPDLRPEDMTGDDDWNQFVTLRVKPHRDLNATQFKTVQLELCGGAMARRLNVRGALLPYLLNSLRITADPTQQRPPDYLLEVMMREKDKDLQRFLFKPREQG